MKLKDRVGKVFANHYYESNGILEEELTFLDSRFLCIDLMASTMSLIPVAMAITFITPAQFENTQVFTDAS